MSEKGPRGCRGGWGYDAGEAAIVGEMLLIDWSRKAEDG